MKIGFISDLHLDNTARHLNEQSINTSIDELIQITLNNFVQNKLDYCIISGDISDRLSLTKEIVAKLNNGGVKVYYTLGNHDLWIRQGAIEEELKQISEDRYCLLNKAVEIDKNFVLVGMYSWYDPSLETMEQDHSYYELRKHLWIDLNYITWKNKTNEAVVQHQLSQTKKLLNQIPQDKTIILVNHFVPHQDFIIHQPNNDNWNFGNAFMGSRLIDHLTKQDNRIKYVTFGHTHHHFGKTKKDNVTYLSFPLGYVHEWSATTYEEQLKQSIGIINLTY